MQESLRPRMDKSVDVSGATRSPLEPFFAPRTVAVIGASERQGSVGRGLLANLLATPFGGAVYPISPEHDRLLGVQAYRNVAAVPGPVDLAVIATPAATIPGIMRECAEAHVRAAIVISAGFGEVGPEGKVLEREMMAAARPAGIRVIGPNCLGVMSPLSGLNATFAAGMARSGNVAFLSQSGALCTAVLDWSESVHLGFSAFVSVGAMADVGWGDLIDHLGNDAATQSIVIYMESIGADARAFLSAAREVALTKPIIVIKPGRSEQARHAAASHTGALAGSDRVLDAAFARAGVLRVDRIADLFAMAEVLGKQPTPRGSRLAIVTNAGGPGVLATDVAVAQGVALPPASEVATAQLDRTLPAAWSHGNPIDILGDAGPDRYRETLSTVLADEANDGVLVILTPQSMTDPDATADQVARAAGGATRPLLASWMGGSGVAAGRRILQEAGIPQFDYPDEAARVFGFMSRYGRQLRELYEIPDLVDGSRETVETRQRTTSTILEAAHEANRTLLTEFESKAILAAYGIPTVDTRLAQTPEAAVEAAAGIGYPVVLKLHSYTVTHKSDVGGVRLDLRDAVAVAAAFNGIRQAVERVRGPGHFDGVTVQAMVKEDGYELILGSSPDPDFGPVLLFGLGGVLVELLNASELALPPLTTTLARRLLERPPFPRILAGFRDRPPVDATSLEALLVRFAQLVVEQPRIREIDVNPLLVSHARSLALDARIVLYEASVPNEALPQTAIRPYPWQYVGTAALRDGTPLLIRPVRPEDEPLLTDFERRLSERSVYLRYLHQSSVDERTTPESLRRVCFADYGRQLTLVAEAEAQEGRRIVGVGRLTKARWDPVAEFALLIADDYQRRGLGPELLRRLLRFARDEGVRTVTAEMLVENRPMQVVSERLGFHLSSQGDGITVAHLDVAATGERR